jgi:hypothetical protein
MAKNTSRQKLNNADFKKIGKLTGIVLTFSGVAAAAIHYKNKKCKTYVNISKLYPNETIKKIGMDSSNGTAFYVGEHKVFKTCNTAKDCYHETDEMKKYENFAIYPKVFQACASYGPFVGYVMERMTGQTLANFVSQKFDVDVVIGDMYDLYRRIHSIPNFKHNDLHLNNIMYHSSDSATNRAQLFVIDPHIQNEEAVDDDLQVVINFMNVIGMHRFPLHPVDLRLITLDNVRTAMLDDDRGMYMWQQCYVLFFLFLKDDQCEIGIVDADFNDIEALWPDDFFDEFNKERNTSDTAKTLGLEWLFSHYVDIFVAPKEAEKSFAFLLFYSVFKNREKLLSLVVMPPLVNTIIERYPGIVDCLQLFICANDNI